MHLACLLTTLLVAGASEVGSPQANHVLRFEYSVGAPASWSPLFEVSAEQISGSWKLLPSSPFQFTEEVVKHLTDGAATDDYILVRVTDSTKNSAQTAVKQVRLFEFLSA